MIVYLKRIVTIVFLVFVLSIFFVGVERVAFYRGHPIVSMEEKTINIQEDNSLAMECKVKRGSNTVLEVFYADNNKTFARCGMWYPFVDVYEIKTLQPLQH